MKDSVTKAIIRAGQRLEDEWGWGVFPVPEDRENGAFVTVLREELTGGKEAESLTAARIEGLKAELESLESQHEEE